MVGSVFLALAVLFYAAAAQSGERPESFADLAQRLQPAVVNVASTQTVVSPVRRGGREERPQAPPGSPFEDFFRDFFDREQQNRGPARRRPAQSLGSGFIIDPSGLVITNNHVIADADEITITMADNRTFKVEVVGRDPKTDLAVLRILSDETFPFVGWGDSDKSRVGDWVLAIGNPFGLGGSVTAGIISARARNINAGPYDDFIQTDASINRGNSGGPLFNTAGEVVGINTAIFSPSGGSVGIGFAIPSNLARPLIDQLIDFGRTRRGWLGVRIQTVTDELAESLGLDKPRGALIAEVTKDGPAEDFGLEQGDVVLSFDGKPVEQMRNLPRIVAETVIGKEVDVVIWRGNREITLKVEVGELPETVPQLAAVDPSDSFGEADEEILGMTLSPLTPDMREQFSLSDEISGVLVTGVSGDGPAAERGLRPGDIILEVAQEEVDTPSELASKVRAAERSGRKSVLLLVQRGGDLRFVAVRLDG
ncbi:MAG: DegQ family serine endoprotease [Proteobacteria bacterium]|nr:DegQ family serine endoprotease [Pseudomonadota bacterium]